MDRVQGVLSGDDLRHVQEWLKVSSPSSCGPLTNQVVLSRGSWLPPAPFLVRHHAYTTLDCNDTRGGSGRSNTMRCEHKFKASTWGLANPTPRLVWAGHWSCVVMVHRAQNVPDQSTYFAVRTMQTSSLAATCVRARTPRATPPTRTRKSANPLSSSLPKTRVPTPFPLLRPFPR